ncbi:Maltose transport system permease protein MalG [Parageobacillus caldoxylosilyticus]|jgi:arabinogalactan oligomer / maltooligosaccharide transport system permease protein|uniref:sugar ABC transporter permease n=1 Tax=Saccharococcus caldoxylosilyticus TaxID=81408 RepID=UPI001C4DE6DD|nr:sugar ABC transporter permease [Parageobacillus caldoxylosilyticus]QXJ37785.1 Maltose transport system permease protein MalG [Parageobacillus caldoxylosilyticus]
MSAKPLRTKKLSGAKFKEAVVTVLIYAFLIISAILVLYPIVWIFIGALNPGDTLYSSTLMPEKITMKHYTHLWYETDYVKWFKNTLFVATMNMILSTFLIVSSAYAFSRFRFPGRRQGLMAMLILQMFPSFMGMIAIYILLLQIGLLDNLWGLILVYAGGSIPFGAWLVKGYFDGLPRSLEEAAKIDGASHTTIFFKVMMPLSVPILTFIAINNFIGPWMDFIFARLVLRSNENKTLAIGLFEMVTGRGNTEFTTFAAGAIIVAIPTTILFLLLQKYIIAGLSAGANKG